MAVLESVKERFEKVTGWARPCGRDLDTVLRQRKANAFRFKDDGVIPNNPNLPFVLYRSPVRLSDKFDPAAVFDKLFERNGWGDSWRNGIYDYAHYAHYHSRIHEVLGVVRGHARVRFGGAKGRALKLKAGDVMILPAGTGHELLSGSKDLLVIGAYPPFGTYDECLTSGKEKEHDCARTTIPKVALPWAFGARINEHPPDDCPPRKALQEPDLFLEPSYSRGVHTISLSFAC
jgi:uncharacterized protein YjlB